MRVRLSRKRNEDEEAKERTELQYRPSQSGGPAFCSYIIRILYIHQQYTFAFLEQSVPIGCRSKPPALDSRLVNTDRGQRPVLRWEWMDNWAASIDRSISKCTKVTGTSDIDSVGLVQAAGGPALLDKQLFICDLHMLSE